LESVPEPEENARLVQESTERVYTSPLDLISERGPRNEGISPQKELKKRENNAANSLRVSKNN